MTRHDLKSRPDFAPLGAVRFDAEALGTVPGTELDLLLQFSRKQRAARPASAGGAPPSPRSTALLADDGNPLGPLGVPLLPAG
jgi:hypothetical protein